jgi:hypothetical protein
VILELHYPSLVCSFSRKRLILNGDSALSTAASMLRG